MIMKLTCLLIPVLCCSVVSASDRSGELGLLRNTYGEYHDGDVPLKTFEAFRFNSASWNDRGVTIEDPRIVFPAGQWTERFYIQLAYFPTGVVKLPEGVVNASRTALVLVLNKKVGNKLVPLWRIELARNVKKRGRPDFHLPKESGTMLRYLYLSGYHVRGRAPRSVMQRLSRQEGLAFYGFLFEHPGYSYWFLDKALHHSRIYSLPLYPPSPGHYPAAGSGDRGIGMYLPRLDGPYPITPEEKKDMGLK